MAQKNEIIESLDGTENDIASAERFLKKHPHGLAALTERVVSLRNEARTQEQQHGGFNRAVIAEIDAAFEHYALEMRGLANSTEATRVVRARKAAATFEHLRQEAIDRTAREKNAAFEARRKADLEAHRRNLANQWQTNGDGKVLTTALMTAEADLRAMRGALSLGINLDEWRLEVVKIARTLIASVDESLEELQSKVSKPKAKSKEEAA